MERFEKEATVLFEAWHTTHHKDSTSHGDSPRKKRIEQAALAARAAVLAFMVRELESCKGNRSLLEEKMECARKLAFSTVGRGADIYHEFRTMQQEILIQGFLRPNERVGREEARPWTVRGIYTGIRAGLGSVLGRTGAPATAESPSTEDDD
jgi:hypothetical protein